MKKTRMRLATPSRIVLPLRVPNKAMRSREYLTEPEVKKLIAAAKDNRHGLRDATMILISYRHGLRASELVDLRWNQVDWQTATLHVRRVNKGRPTTHSILRDELRALRCLQREQEPKSPFVFTSQRGEPLSKSGFAKLIERAGEAAKLNFKAHPFMLRHACGYALANRGYGAQALQFYLGYNCIQSTIRATQSCSVAFDSPVPMAGRRRR